MSLRALFRAWRARRPARALSLSPSLSAPPPLWPWPWTLLALLVVAVTAAGGCTDVPEPYELDHARVMAVRVEPPAIPAGATARIDALVTDSSVVPRVAAAGDVTVALPGALARPELAGLVARGDDGWLVTAPGEDTLAAARAALGLAAGAPIIVSLELRIETADGPLLAEKTLALGAAAANPPAPVIAIDGAPGELAMRVGRESVLTVTEPVDERSYRWFSSVGELSGYTRAEARIEPDAAASGYIAVVVRDQAGGTAWTIAEASVARP